MTRIDQEGRAIYGVMRELVTNRAWILEGDIDQVGFLRGTYRLDGVDGPRGTFLLAVDASGQELNGLWATHDVAAREIKSGQYSMQRCSDSG